MSELLIYLNIFLYIDDIFCSILQFIFLLLGVAQSMLTALGLNRLEIVCFVREIFLKVEQWSCSLECVFQTVNGRKRNI